MTGASELLEFLLSGDFTSQFDWSPSLLDSTINVLRDLSLDSASFYSAYAVRRDGLADALAARHEAGAGAWAPLLAIATLFARCVDESVKVAVPEQRIGRTDMEPLKRLVSRTPGFASALKRLFALPTVVPGSDLVIDWTSLRAFKLGTTSLIFRLETKTKQRLVLKLTHVLFASVGPIADATRHYAQDWQVVGAESPYVVSVYASGSNWVIEEYVHGDTLREFMHNQRTLSLEKRLAVGKDAFEAILEALASLHQTTATYLAVPCGHGDLNPSNIIITMGREGLPSPRDNPELRCGAKFIDMGRNLLASTTIARVRSLDAKYVAPEVQSAPPEARVADQRADYFSLGHLLGYCFGYPGADGFYELDTDLYAEVPDLARIASHLVRPEPEAREAYLLSLGSRSNSPEALLGSLGSYVHELIDVLGHLVGRSASYSMLEAALFSIVGSLSSFEASIKYLHRARKARSVPLLGRVAPVRGLVAGLVYFAVMAICFGVLLGGDGLLLNRGQVVLEAFTFEVASYQYATRVFGGITFAGIRSKLAVVCEVLLWATGVVVLPLLLIALVAGYRAWPWCVFGGLVVITVTSICILVLRSGIDRAIAGPEAVQRYLATAEAHGLDPINESNVVIASLETGQRGFADYEPVVAAVASAELGMSAWRIDCRVSEQLDTDILRYWTPTLIAFTVLAGGLAFLNQPLHAVRDLRLDALAIAAVTVAVLNYSQILRQGAKVRANVTQYMVAGELVQRV